MNLREQFEKETGEPWSYDGYLATKSYIEWLEQRNKEQVEVLKDVKRTLDHLAKQFDFPEEMQESESYQKIEEQLKKSCVL